MGIALFSKVKKIFKADPKPIFDHFRNIAIAAGLAIGAGYIGRVDFVGFPFHFEKIIQIASYLTLFVSIVLLTLNVSFAQISINKFLFDKTEFDTILGKLMSGLAVYSYSVLLIGLIIVYMFAPIVQSAKKPSISSTEFDAFLADFESTKERLNLLLENNAIYREEIERLKNENAALKKDLRKINQTMQPTAESGG